METCSTEDTDDLARKMFKQRFQRMNFVINDLITIRLEKHFKASLIDEPIEENLPQVERETRNRLTKLLKNHRKSALGINVMSSIAEVMDTNNFEYNPSVNGYETVYFLENELEQFLGSDLKTYGPFLKGSYALIPVENVKELLKRNQIRIIENVNEK